MVKFIDLLNVRFNLTEIIGVAKRNCDMPIKSENQEEELFNSIDQLPHDIIITKDTAKVFLRCLFRTVLLRHKSLKLGASPSIQPIDDSQVQQIIAAYAQYYPKENLTKEDFNIENIASQELHLLNEDDITKTRKLIRVVTLLLFIVSQTPIQDSSQILQETGEVSMITEDQVEKLLNEYNLGEHTKMLYMAANSLYK